MNWQPIETAPKDGRHVLVCGIYLNEPYVTVAAFVEGTWVVCAPLFDECYYLTLQSAPTHWAELPALPGDDSMKSATHCSATYYACVDAANEATRGRFDGSWNADFLTQLQKRGLTLSAKLPEPDDGKYPGGLPYQAPVQYGPKNGWPEKTFIVWMSRPVISDAEDQT